MWTRKKSETQYGLIKNAHVTTQKMKYQKEKCMMMQNVIIIYPDNKSHCGHMG